MQMLNIRVKRQLNEDHWQFNPALKVFTKILEGESPHRMQTFPSNPIPVVNETLNIIII